MRYAVSFGVRVASQQKAVSLRDRMLAWLENEPDVEIFNWSAARMDPEWQAVGVDTATGQPFVVTVIAETWEEAEAIILGEVPTRVIAAYRGPGGVVIPTTEPALVDGPELQLTWDVEGQVDGAPLELAWDVLGTG